MDDLSFGIWLKRRRRGLGLTQNELAHRAGYSGETIRKVEADALRPSRQMAEKLADHLAIAPDERAAFIRFARGEPEAGAALPPFPAGLAGRRAGLPTPPSELIGRDTETAALRQMLLDGSVRLLSLLGAPGIGKTRLALHTAALLEPAFADGAGFVALAPLSDPALVAGELARGLGVSETGGQSLTDRLIGYLRARNMLLVLDNFEHLLPAAALVAELLAACPSLKVLVTSRAALHLSGEREFDVPALALPWLTPLPPLDSLSNYSAVALYVQRTQAIKPGFRLAEANAPAVAEICVRLDGLPLAIELAAARSKLFSPAALLARLTEHERLALLTSDARDRPARQRTLRNTIDWSYNLLEPAAQTLFARLAVFAGGCTLEAAESVCGELPPLPRLEGSPTPTAQADRLQVDGLLGALIDHSLVRHTDGPGGEPRFWMLETLREYALERLAASGEIEALQRRHATYYLALAERGQVRMYGAEQRRWLDHLAADHDNFRAALAWSLKSTNGAILGLRLANGLATLWQVRAYYAEAINWFTAVLGRSQDTPSLHRVEGLTTASRLTWLRYDYQHQNLYAREAVALARQLGSPRHLCRALNRMVSALHTGGDFAGARAAGQESLALARSSGDIRAEAEALEILGQMARNQSDHAAARSYGEQGLALAVKMDDPIFEALLRHDVGMANWFEGRFAQASEHLRKSSQLYEAAGDQRFMGVVEWGLGCVALDQGELATATTHFRRCLVAFRASDYSVGLCGYLLGIAGIATARGQAVAAVRLSGAADAWRALLGHRLEGHLPARYERQLARARAQLDEDTFAAAWAAGRALPVEQAIVEALAQEVDGPEEA